MAPSSDQTHANPKQPVGLFYTWWRGDPLPDLDPLEKFSLEPTDDPAIIAHMSDLTEQEASDRMRRGHRPYIARLGETPVAYGWSAWEYAEIGELGVERALPEGAHYLWDFVTLPDWRGMGLYPHMIQGIIRAEQDIAERFWIGHDLDNVASARGIEKAGLPVIGEVWLRDGQPVVVGREPRERAQMATQLLQLPLEGIRADGLDDKASR